MTYTALVLSAVLLATVRPAHTPTTAAHHATSAHRTSIGFALASFDTSIAQLPAHYPGHSIAAIYDTLHKLATKDEFETTESYQRRLAGMGTPTFVYAFWVDRNLSASFDADRSLMTVPVQVEEIVQPAAEDVAGTISDRRKAVRVLWHTFSQDKYAASNAYGATVTVDRSYVDVYQILPVGPELTREENEGDFNLRFPLPPERARLLHDRLCVLLICEIARPDNGEPLAWQGFLSTNPTLDEPIKVLCNMCYLNARIIALWVCDRATGEVLLKHMPSAD